MQFFEKMIDEIKSNNFEPDMVPSEQLIEVLSVLGHEGCDIDNRENVIVVRKDKITIELEVTPGVEGKVVITPRIIEN